MGTLWIGMALLLAAALIIFFALRFRGGAQRIDDNFNVTEERQDATTADAAGGAEARPDGEFVASASVDGVGSGSGSATVGHEFTYTGNNPKEFRLRIAFRHRTTIAVSDLPGEVSATISAVVAPNSQNFLNEALNVIDNKQIPAPPAASDPQPFRDEVAEFRVTLDPNQSVQIVVTGQANAKAGTPGDEFAGTPPDPGRCNVRIEGQVTQVLLDPA